ncbi:MAG: hypothetical protein ACLQPH_00750 [Acidimicrobiales bacterium]
MQAEGWYKDPFGLHEARWFSVGAPTALVRDGASESTDPPPDTPLAGPPEPLDATPDHDGSDLRRADEAEKGDGIFDPNASAEGAWEAFGQSGGD